MKEKIGAYTSKKKFLLFLKNGIIFLFKLFYNFVLPEPAAWVGAGQDWTGSTTLGTGTVLSYPPRFHSLGGVIKKIFKISGMGKKVVSVF